MAKLGQTARNLLTAGLLCAAPAVFAAPVNMTLTGVGSNGTLGGVYIGPYEASIDGGVPVKVICDDFADDTYLYESWMANVHDFSDLSATRWAGPNATQLYNEAAWLSMQLLNPPAYCGPGANCAGDIQFAIWQLLDSGDPHPPQSYLSGIDLSNMNYWLTKAGEQTFTPGEFSNVSIYTYAGNATYANGAAAAGPPQEFLVIRTPEPSALGLLGVDFLALGALVFLVHRRRARTAA